jgi:hypothetical protein
MDNHVGVFLRIKTLKLVEDIKKFKTCKNSHEASICNNYCYACGELLFDKLTTRYQYPNLINELIEGYEGDELYIIDCENKIEDEILATGNKNGNWELLQNRDFVKIIDIETINNCVKQFELTYKNIINEIKKSKLVNSVEVLFGYVRT